MKKIITVMALIVMCLIVSCAKDARKETEVPEGESFRISDPYRGRSLEQLREEYPEYFEMSEFKGIEVYVWEMAEGCYCCGMMQGTNRMKTDEEIWGLANRSLTMDETRLILNELHIPQDEVFLIPVIQPYSSYLYEIDDEYINTVYELFYQ